jgi:hypothetical protein
MIPQISRRLIRKYGENASLLFDPYCGSGTSLVEARLNSMNAVGTDLNPLARLITEVKTRDYKIEVLEKNCNAILNKMGSAKDNIEIFEGGDDIAVTHETLLKWFPERTIVDIGHIKDTIMKNSRNEMIKKFLLITLSECLRLVSYQRNHEFKLYRIKEEERSDFFVDLYPLFERRLERNLNGVKDFMKSVSANTKVRIYDFNTVDRISGRKIRKNSVNLVVTSPPYGDSGTTVAYGQYSWLGNVWLNLSEVPSGKLDRNLMGGGKTDVTNFGFDLMDETMAKITEVSEVRPERIISMAKALDLDPDEALARIHVGRAYRAKEIMDFYREYELSIANVCTVIEEGGHACYVVSNRTVSGEKLPTDKFTQWVFEKNGFEHIITHGRNIPNKRMPSRNSPSNIAGKTLSTMVKEHIIVMRKR